MTLPTKEQLNAYDMRPIMNQFNKVPEVDFINEPAGKNHYRLLRWIAENYEHKHISELGTYMGLGTLCLRTEKNYIHTYDTNFEHLHIKKRPDNVQYILAPHTTHFHPLILFSQIIFVDTWHEGIMERAVYDYLVSSGWKGLLIYDDIHWSDNMMAFWDSLPEPKIDATHIGHATGTGIIEFI